MNNEEPNSDNTFEYDDESFDNGSSEEAASEEDSISEISSEGQLLEELLPDNSSIEQSQVESAENSTLELDNRKDSAIYLIEGEEAHTGDTNKDGKQVGHFIEANVGIEEPKPEAPETLDTKVFSEENQIVQRIAESANSASTNSHEVDESESDVEVDLVDSVKSLNMNTDKKLPEVVSEGKGYSSKNDYTNDLCCNKSEIEFSVTSQTPTSFNSDNHAFHMDITHKPTGSTTSIQQRPRNVHRKSLSFSNERMREIERHNQILLRKILTQKPRKESINQKVQCPNVRMTTSAVNRKKQQRQIDLDNQVLKRKIEAIALRRPQKL